MDPRPRSSSRRPCRSFRSQGRSTTWRPRARNRRPSCRWQPRRPNRPADLNGPETTIVEPEALPVLPEPGAEYDLAPESEESAPELQVAAAETESALRSEWTRDHDRRAGGPAGPSGARGGVRPGARERGIGARAAGGSRGDRIGP